MIKQENREEDEFETPLLGFPVENPPISQKQMTGYVLANSWQVDALYDVSTLITFSPEDMPSNVDMLDPLSITIECNGILVPGVIVDNGAAYNICSQKIWFKFGGMDCPFEPCDQHMIGFDNSSEPIMGFAWLTLGYGPLIQHSRFATKSVLSS